MALIKHKTDKKAILSFKKAEKWLFSAKNSLKKPLIRDIFAKNGF